MGAEVLTNLADRCDAASKPSRALDRSIHKAVKGRVPRDTYIPFYTSNKDAAYRLLPLSFSGMITVRDDRWALDLTALSLRQLARDLRLAKARGEQP